MRASNYTPVDAVKKLHEELDKLFAGKTFSGQGKNKPLNIFDFEFPTDFGNDEDVDTVAAAAPFILVKAAGWSIDTTGNLAALDGEGNLTDSGKKPADFVAAEAGKRLMTDAEGEKLAGVSEGATKTAASSTNGNVNIDGKEVVVYTEPENVLHDEDVEDFSAEEIAALLAD